MAGNPDALVVKRLGLRTVVVTTIAEVGTDKTVVSLLDMGIVIFLTRAGALVGVLWVSPDKGEQVGVHKFVPVVKVEDTHLVGEGRESVLQCGKNARGSFVPDAPDLSPERDAIRHGEDPVEVPAHVAPAQRDGIDLHLSRLAQIGRNRLTTDFLGQRLRG